MTTFQPMSLKSVASREDTKILPAQLGYLTSKAQSEAHELVLSLFLKLSECEPINKAFLAKRLGKKPEQITRWLSAPSNLTVATLAELLAAMGYVPRFDAHELGTKAKDNFAHPLCGAKYTLPDTLLKMSRVTPSNDGAVSPQVRMPGLVLKPAKTAWQGPTSFRNSPQQPNSQSSQIQNVI